MNANNKKILKYQSVNVKTLLNLIYFKRDDRIDQRNLTNIQKVIHAINQKWQSHVIHGIHIINQKKSAPSETNNSEMGTWKVPRNK